MEDITQFSPGHAGAAYGEGGVGGYDDYTIIHCRCLCCWKLRTNTTLNLEEERFYQEALEEKEKCIERLNQINLEEERFYQEALEEKEKCIERLNQIILRDGEEKEECIERLNQIILRDGIKEDLEKENVKVKKTVFELENIELKNTVFELRVLFFAAAYCLFLVMIL